MAIANSMSDQILSGVPRRSSEGKTTFVSIISSMSAVLAACSCCILPMALAGVGLSAGLSNTLSPLGSLRWPMTAFSVVAVTASWLIVLRKSRRECACASNPAQKWFLKPQVLVLLVATKFTFVAAAWSFFEPTLMSALM